MRGMGRAGQALREVLTKYGVSQNKLAVTMGLKRSAVYKWFHEERDPTAETVEAIVIALKTLEIDAAKEFVYLYLGQILDEEWWVVVAIARISHHTMKSIFLHLSHLQLPLTNPINTNCISQLHLSAIGSLPLHTIMVPWLLYTTEIERMAHYFDWEPSKSNALEMDDIA